MNYIGCSELLQRTFEINERSFTFYYENSELNMNIINFSNNSEILYCFWEGKWVNLSLGSYQHMINEKAYNIYLKIKTGPHCFDDFILNKNPSQLLSELISSNPKRTLGKIERPQNNSMLYGDTHEYLARVESLTYELQIKNQKIAELEAEKEKLIKDGYQQLQNKNQVLPHTLQTASLRAMIDNPIELISALNNASKHPLPNYGNTCYLNAIIQVLASMNVFILELIKAKDSVLKSLGSLLINMRLPNKRSEVDIGIQQFKQDLSQFFPNLNNNDQQDSKEVLEMIFSKFEEEFPNSSLFVSNFTQTFKCDFHNFCTILNGSQNFLLIPPRNYNNIEGFLQSLKNPKIQERHELLICDLCGTNSISTMRSVLISKPIYLILSFQSLSAAPRLTESLSFEENRYSLFGVVSYTASGSSGHYTAYTKENYSWKHYNDEHIENVGSIDEIYGVYLAFYLLNSLVC